MYGREAGGQGIDNVDSMAAKLDTDSLHERI